MTFLGRGGGSQRNFQRTFLGKKSICETSLSSQIIEGLVLSKHSRPVEGVDFDKTLALPPLKMLKFLSNKDFIPQPH